MRLPNKVTSFKDSTLSLFQILLNEIRAEDISPIGLFEKVRGDVGDISNYLEALDCLFALEKIELDEQSGVLSYVD